MLEHNPEVIRSPRRYLHFFFITVLIGFVGAWTYSAFGQIFYMDRDFGQWSGKGKMLAACSVGDVALLGDSRASAELLPKLVKPMVVRNLALTGATPVETYFEFEQILKCTRRPKVIVLAFSPLQFMQLNWYWSHAARYHFLSFADMEDVRRQAAVIHDRTLYLDAFGAEPPPMIKDWLYATSFPPYNFSSVIAAGVGLRRPTNLRFLSETLQNDGQHLEGDAACARFPTPETNEDHFVVHPLIKVYLDRLLADAAAHNTMVVAATPPMSAMTADGLRPQFANEFEAFFKRQFASRLGVRAILPAIPRMENCLYGDDFHLNQKGAERYSSGFAASLNAALAR